MGTTASVTWISPFLVRQENTTGVVKLPPNVTQACRRSDLPPGDSVTGTDVSEVAF